jgi:hypothetical protein
MVHWSRNYLNFLGKAPQMVFSAAFSQNGVSSGSILAVVTRQFENLIESIG